ncbi:MAG: hypothetical protein WEB58_19350 [Planctomycetaceae bacterium]
MSFFLYHGTAVSQEKPDEWKTVKLIEQDGFSFRLKHRPEASIADEEWLMLELENVDSNREFIDIINFVGSYETQPTGYPSSSLGAGMGDYDVRLAAGIAETRERLKITKGKTLRIIQPISHSATGAMRFPPEVGVEIKGIVNLWVNMSFGGGTDEVRLRTPRGGISFIYKWTRPPESKIDELEKRLRLWLDQPVDRKDFRYNAATQRIFEVPQIADRFTTDELNELFLNGRQYRQIEDILYQRDSQNEHVIDWYIDKIAQDDYNVHLLKHSPFWSPKYMTPIVNILDVPERGYFHEIIRGYMKHKSSTRLDWNHPKDEALRLLKKHSDAWQKHPEWSFIIEEAKRDRHYRRMFQAVGHGIYLIRWIILAGIAVVVWWTRRWYKRRLILKPP